MICVFMGSRDECVECGCFAGRDCIVNEHGRYCSVECAHEYGARMDGVRRDRATEWCPACGYDRHEHAPDCAALGGE